MGQITIDLIRKRAEHNEGMISNLEELALHQQHIEKIELLNRATRHLRILLLQSNLIHKIQNLHRMKELQYLNLALNNVSKIQNLQRCESLTKLDLTMNFIPKQGLLTVHTLQQNEHLRDLYLVGNPCADWTGYRPYVVAAVPHVTKLDGKDIKPSERIAAKQVFDSWHSKLVNELTAEGIDVAEAARAEDDGLEYSSDMEVEDPGFVDPEDGEFKRPWCPATRILEHRENERVEREQAEQKQASQNASSSLYGAPEAPPRLEDFPEIKEGERVYQKNEGQWDFYLEESDDGKAVELDVQLGKYMDTTLVKADVQPEWARLLVKGRLLQLKLPCPVVPDTSAAHRSKASGRLVLTMPKLHPQSTHLDVACMRPRPGGRENRVKAAMQPMQPGKLRNSEHAQLPEVKSQPVHLANITKQAPAQESGFSMRAARKAQITACVSDDDDDDDAIPSL